MGQKVNPDVEPIPAHLSCNHSILFRPPYPRARDTVWCKRCSLDVTVIAVAETYGIVCDTCPRYSRRYGTDMDAAQRAASRHVLKYPRHSIEIRKGPTLIERVTNQGTQDELPFAQVLSKRATQVAQSQRLLREMTDRTIDKAHRATSVVTDQPAQLHQEEA